MQALGCNGLTRPSSRLPCRSHDHAHLCPIPLPRPPNCDQCLICNLPPRPGLCPGAVSLIVSIEILFHARQSALALRGDGSHASPFTIAADLNHNLDHDTTSHSPVSVGQVIDATDPRTASHLREALKQQHAKTYPALRVASLLRLDPHAGQGSSRRQAPSRTLRS